MTISDPIAALETFSTAMADADGQPEHDYRALGAFADTLIGVRLFTLTIVDIACGEARRVHSSHPEAYPVSGIKSIEPNDWTRRVLDAGKIFVANDIDAIAAVFPDHELIRSLGCESVVNVPCIAMGSVLGTVNCLHAAGHYDPGRVRLAATLSLPGVACFLSSLRDTASAVAELRKG